MDDAINLLTSHSAKGLEWPVVIVLGLWRGIGKPPERGMKLVRDTQTGTQVFFDLASAVRSVMSPSYSSLSKFWGFHAWPDVSLR